MKLKYIEIYSYIYMYIHIIYSYNKDIIDDRYNKIVYLRLYILIESKSKFSLKIISNKFCYVFKFSKFNMLKGFHFQSYLIRKLLML